MKHRSRAAVRVTCALAICAALAIAQGPAPSELEQIQQDGRKAIAEKNLPRAEEIFRAGIDKAKAASDRSWEAEFLRSVGETFERRDQLAEARSWYVKSLEIREALGQKPQRALLLGGIGFVSLRLRDDATAEQYLTRAIEAYRELNDNRNVAQTLLVIGQLQGRRGQDEQALKTIEESVATYEKIPDPRGVAVGRGVLADLHYQRAEYRAALAVGFPALDVHRQMNNDQETAKVLEVIGNVFNRLEQHEKALQYYRDALAIREKLGARQSIAGALNNIGAALSALGKDREALEPLGRALELRRTGAAPSDLAQTLHNLAVVQQRLGKTDEAGKAWAEALAIDEKYSYKRQAGTVLYELGNLAQAKNDQDKAYELHRRALEIRIGLQDRLGSVHSRNRLALVLEAKGDLPGSEKMHEQALEEFEKLTQQVADPVQLGAFRQTSAILYPHLTRVLMKEGKTPEAFLVAERGRGAGLSRLAALNTANFVALLTPEQAKAWQAATANVARASNHLRVIEEKGGGNSRARDDAAAAFSDSQRDLLRLRDEFFASNPKLQSPEAPKPPAIDRFLAFAKEHPDALFLEWVVVDDDSSRLLVLSSAGVRGFDLPVGRRRLAEISNAWYRSLSAPGPTRGFSAPTDASSAADEPKHAREMYQAAFGPAMSMLAGDRHARLVVVADGPLLGIPFAALADVGGRRLVERYAITRAVSVAGLMTEAARSKPSRSLLAVADPMNPSEERIVVPLAGRYTPLQHAREEARAIAALYPDGSAMYGATAREAEIKKTMGQFAVLHFATHGVLMEGDALESGLLLATEPETSSEDGFLQGWEIVTSSLSARLAVLSACATGRGEERLGEGLMGLAWAFQAAGCPDVVASLWNVDDAATRELMVTFYDGLKKGLKIDDALRAAMLKTRARRGYESPYYWAAFEAIGQSVAISSKF